MSKQLIAARVKNTELLENSTSGGITRYVIQKLLETHKADGVICVVLNPVTNKYEYRLLTKATETNIIAKSVYQRIPISPVLQKLSKDLGNYALIATPCTIKYLQQAGYIFKYTITFVCRGYFSNECVSSLIPNNNSLISIEWRTGKKPNNLTTRIISQDTENNLVQTEIPITPLRKSKTNLAPACQSCTYGFMPDTDLTVSDAWLPQYSDKEGTTLCICRNDDLIDIIKDKNNIEFEIIPEDAFWHKNILNNNKYEVVE